MLRRLTYSLVAACGICFFYNCCPKTEDFSKEELNLIYAKHSLGDGMTPSDSAIMRVLTIEDSLDLIVLRAQSRNLSDEALMSDAYKHLVERMLATVTHPSQDGVGIAAPQVGLNRRVVAVQRFDKEPVINEGKPVYPFEVYPNINLIWASDSLVAGPEGCLSVPDMRGDVLRSHKIVIEYSSIDYCEGSTGINVETIRDTIEGFTAVIFQHEIDHLQGTLYIDHLYPASTDCQ